MSKNVSSPNSEPKRRERHSKFKKYDDFTVVDSLRSLPFVLFAIEAAYALVLLATGFNFLAVCAIAFSMGFALMLFWQSLRGYVSRWTAASFILSDASLILYFFIWGAGNAVERFALTLAFTVVPIALATLVLLFPKFEKLGKKHVFAACCALVMVGVTVFYFLACSFKAKPVVESLMKGHDDYLASVAKTKKQNRPNVLFILMDDMGYADISLYSYLNGKGLLNSGVAEPSIKTPNIDSIAEDGVFFDNFYASSPVCSPSRFGILTGRYCSRGYLDNVVFPSNVSLSPFGNTRYFNPFQFLNNVDGILGDEITIAEVLKAQGYSTALFGKWNLGDYGEYLPTNQGFDYFYGSHYVNDMTPYNFVEEKNGQYHEVFTHAQMADQSITTQRITEKMNPYLETQIANSKGENGTPFFTYYCTPWPHAPLFSNANGNGQGDITDDTYVDCIEEFDAYLGTTLDLIYSDPEVAENTIIIFTSDNGPGKEGATGALKGRKNTTFEGGHKVPMLVKFGDKLKTDDPVSYKNIAGEEKSTYRVTSSYMNIDIFPTLLKYMDIPLPDDRVIDGVSMLDAMTNKTPSNAKVKPREGDYRVLYYIKKGVVQSLQMPAYADGELYDFKYYLNVLNENSAFIDQYYKNFLFNLDTDPIEGYNVSKKYPDVAATLKNTLLSFRKELATNRRGIIKK